jgi:predicted transcriptional regulator
MTIILSITPRFSQLIFAGFKKYELRKTPIKNGFDKLVFVYESAPTKAIVGSFKIKGIFRQAPDIIWDLWKETLGISQGEFLKYFKGRQWGYAIEVDQPKRLKKQITLNELRKIEAAWRPPQSFQYLKENSKIEQLLKRSIDY